jgi:twinfilin
MLIDVPDTAKVRQKMLYASTKGTLIKELGEVFADSIYATTKNELTLEGYNKHRTHKESAAPLSEQEIEFQKLKLNEVLLSRIDSDY